MVLPESLRAHREFKIQAVTVEFLDPAGRNDHAALETVLDHVQREDQGVDEGRGQAVVFG